MESLNVTFVESVLNQHHDVWSVHFGHVHSFSTHQ